MKCGVLTICCSNSFIHNTLSRTNSHDDTARSAGSERAGTQAIQDRWQGKKKAKTTLESDLWSVLVGNEVKMKNNFHLLMGQIGKSR